LLYRVFRGIDGADLHARGGPLYVPRERQGAGRHDSPGRYGAFYAARTAEGATAEAIQAFRGRGLTDEDLINVDGSGLSLATIDDAGLEDVVDLDEPAVLVEQGWRPSAVASRVRVTTQAMAAHLFDEGARGLSWWSTLDAAWTNVTLFAERTIAGGEIVVEAVERLDTKQATVVAAADHLSISLEVQRPRSPSQRR